MSTVQQFQDQLAKLDAATNAIAATLTDLRDKIANAGIAAADEDAVLASLDAAVSKLQGLGTPETPQEPPAEPTV